MVQRLLRGGQQVLAYDINEAAIQAVEAAGAQGARSLQELVSGLDAPRSVWVMVPSGKIPEDPIHNLADLLSAGDTIIDGGNSYYKDSQRRAGELAARGLNFIDAGTSGGIWGLEQGYSLMVGGDKAVVERHRPIFEALAPAADQGWGRVGPAGAGHFVKMIHNGIEYGLMEAYGEGFEILEAKQEFDLDLHQVAEIWRYGSVIRSWLLDLTTRALEEDSGLKDIRAWVADSGEGRWTTFEAIDLDVSAPVITLSLQQRIRSRDEDPFSARLVAAMRHQFGGHEVKKE
ncbi:MAG TPA: decarboxylating 6-phosphogluconate dehydrogenase, partial [Anaerolinea sp.]|nr:decarboxylating 6-phosphogluconate dehydrogenase [Anaerolinea sp.]